MAVPLGDAVFLHHRASLGEADTALRIGLERPVVVGDDQGVAAQRGRIARIAGVFPPAEQAVLLQQAGHESQVGFVELAQGGQHGIDRRVGDVQAVRGRQGALAHVVGEHGRQDAEHAQVLKRPRIDPRAQEGQPGLDDQLVAGQAAVRPQQTKFGDVAMEGAQLGAAL